MKKIIFLLLYLSTTTVLLAQKDKAFEKIIVIRKKLTDGADFCELAKKYSEDVASARYCGQIGMYEKNELVKNYADMMVLLKVGEISNVIETEYGYHIIQLLSVQGSKYETRHILIKH